MSLGLARVWPREAAGVQVPWATSLAMNFAFRARRFAADRAIANCVRPKVDAKSGEHVIQNLARHGLPQLSLGKYLVVR